MSKQMKTLDLRKLAANFADEKSKDELYWQRNDAKFRAVHQRCANYDEFRQIVQAAHLRPLDRNETLNLEARSVAWNQAATKNQPSSVGSVSSEPSVPVVTSLIKPKNHTEFLQQWRRIDDKNKIAFLHQLDNFQTLFQTDVPPDLVYQLALLYDEESTENDAIMIIDLLIEISKSKRFELIKGFLSKENKCQIDLLFSRLSSFVHLRFSVFLLRNLFDQ